MPALFQSWRRLAAIGLSLSALLAGCASTTPLPPDTLLQDQLFGAPSRPVDADAVMALSAPMQAHLQALRGQVSRHDDLAMALAQSLYRPRGEQGGLRLDYDASTTRNAAEAFAARSGNCLSLVVMTAAMADALGLEVGFQEVPSEDFFRREGELTLRTGHVNLVLGESARHRSWRTLGTEATRRQLVIDFLPQASAQALPAVPITRQRVLAMFMNNRAVEALIDRQTASAYAWAREALRADPGFVAAFNTLGVVYQRSGHQVQAAAAYEWVLKLDGRQVAALDNLAQVRHAQGRVADARDLEQRRLALEPVPPFHFLKLGQAALAAQDWPLARRHFQRELRNQPDSHEAWFGLARVHLALGDRASAEDALRQAQAASATAGEQARYAGKLAALRALAVH